MIPNYQDRKVDSNSITETAAFGISLNDSAHIMTILRDTLYSDKVLAVLREYSANAWDAHRMVGKRDVPIKIVLPTLKEPTLVIQDFGPGLSHEDVFQVYTQYGASTKRDSNEAVGQLGIGSKSGFAYSDSFTIVSCFGGIRRTYIAVLDETEKGTINLLFSEPCDIGTGISIQIPVKAEDIDEFTEKAQNLFQYFVPRPDINTELEPELPDIVRLKNGIVYPEDNGASDWVAIMGCIPYRINLDQLPTKDEDSDEVGVGYWIHKLGGALYFNIGQVHIAASREELKYSKLTKTALTQKFNDLVDEYVEQTLKFIETGAWPMWEKRLRAQVMSRLKLPVPEACKDLTKDRVHVQHQDLSIIDDKVARDDTWAEKFTLMHHEGSSIRYVYVDRRAKFLLLDDARKSSGFNLPTMVYLVKRNDEKTSWEDVQIELDAYLLKKGLDGITIGKLSDQPWTPPYQKPKKTRIINKKHLKRRFILKPDGMFYHPYSSAWDAVDVTRQATPEDVFVIIQNFQSVGCELFGMFRKDDGICKAFGLTMPDVYGYKTTEKKPLTPTDVVGIHYPDWRPKLLEKLLAMPEVTQWIYTYQWYLLQEKSSRYGEELTKGNRLLIQRALGKAHPISTMLRHVEKACSLWKKYDTNKREAISRLSKRAHETVPSAPKLAFDALFERYPLIKTQDEGFCPLWKEHSIQWLEYIQLIDRALPLGLITAFTPVKEDEEGDIDDDINDE